MTSNGWHTLTGAQNTGPTVTGLDMLAVPTPVAQGQPPYNSEEPSVASEPLYGLAADLAGKGTSVPVGQANAPLAVRPPARLGSTTSKRMGQPAQAPEVRVARASSSVAQAAPDPFNLVLAQQEQPPPRPDGEAQYGLALELLNNQELGFPSSEPPASHVSRSRRAPVARLAATPVSTFQPHPLDPFTVMELAANQAGLPEPDYGIVAELRNREPRDPFSSDFGLVAEVARRRSRSPTPLGGGTGILPPLRARRRLDSTVPPAFTGTGAGGTGSGTGGGGTGSGTGAGGTGSGTGAGGFGLAEEMAARQQQDAVDIAQPFSAAARAGELDPFALADEQLKVPRELLEPYEATQQELPDDDVQLKPPGEDVQNPSVFSRDEKQYGIAQELGAESTTDQARQVGADSPSPPLPGQPAPMELREQAKPSHYEYTYDDDTGMLTKTADGHGAGGRVARHYIEDEVTGIFYKLQSKRRKIFGLLRRKPHAVVEEDEDEEYDKGFRGRLRRTLVVLTNICNVLGMFAQGLVAGFALLNFSMTYLLYSSTRMRKFLSYYAPLAQNNNRIYYALITLSVISSTSRLAQDKLRSFEPRSLQLGPVDVAQLILYVGAYITSVVCTPLDDELTYESNRNPRFYELTWTSAFKRRMSLWHSLNIIRTVFVALAWLLTCYQTSPYVFEATLRADLRTIRRQQALLQGLSGAGAATTSRKVA